MSIGRLSLTAPATTFPSVQNWATVTEGTSTNGTFSTLTNPDSNGINYRLGTWTATGAFTVLTAGLVEYLIISGGGGGINRDCGYGGDPGGGGRIMFGYYYFDVGTFTVTIGAGGNGTTLYIAASTSGATSVGSVLQTGRSIAGSNNSSYGTTWLTSSITGSSVNYAKVGDPTTKGGGGLYTGNGAAGYVAIRWRTS